MLSWAIRATPLTLAILAVLAVSKLGCSSPREALLERRLPPGFPLPSDARHVESISLGNTATHRYATEASSPSEALSAMRAALATRGWPLDDDGVATRWLDLTLTVTATATASGTSLEISTVRDAVASAAPQALLAGPPAGYPQRFPFVPGGRLRSAPGERPVEIDYRDVARPDLAKKIRGPAERAEWMCTQESERFVCARGARSVDVTLWRKGEIVRAVFRDEG